MWSTERRIFPSEARRKFYSSRQSRDATIGGIFTAKLAVDENLAAEVRSTIKLALNIACDLTGSDGGSIMMVSGENLFISAYKSPDPSIDPASKIGITMKIGERVAGKSAQTGESIIIIGDISKDSRFSALKKYYEIKSGASVAIKQDGKIKGVININRVRSSAPITKDDVDIVDTIGKHLAEII